MTRHIILLFFLILSIWLLAIECAHAQFNPNTPNTGGVGGPPGTSNGSPLPSGNNPNANTANTDSSLTHLMHRNPSEDSISIYYRYLNGINYYYIDSSINDYNKRYVVPYEYNTLGNMGDAAQSLVFKPIVTTGFDIGFHAFDIYLYTVEGTKFFKTSRPFVELAYILANKGEQTVQALYTQNYRSNFNLTFDFRFFNSPGYFRNQNSSNSNLRLSSNYFTKNKRYNLDWAIISNVHKASENGGLVAPNQLDSLAFGDPFQLNVRLGNISNPNRNPFNTSVLTGNIYKDFTLFINQHYDIGTTAILDQNDTVNFAVFYPKVRFELSNRITTRSYNFIDNNPDSASYQQYFGYTIFSGTSLVSYLDKWQEYYNQFSFYGFPQRKNGNQFFRVDVAMQNMKAEYLNQKNKFYNLIVGGEYRNKTKNKKWDILAQGQVNLLGYNSGNYSAKLSFERFFSRKAGQLSLSVLNISRSPSMIYGGYTSFPLDNQVSGISKNENTILLGTTYNIQPLRLKIQGEYYILNNYIYFKDFFNASQYSGVVQLWHAYAEKQFHFAKYLNLYLELHVQQTNGNNAPVRVPFVVSRTRFAFEGLFLKRLSLATGIEARYFTPYQANNYSPYLAQYVFQNSYTVNNRPDVNYYINFRIRSFTAFIRLENLNTFGKKGNTYGFGSFNQSLQYYYTNTLWFRFAIYWDFLN
ncbi:MAG: hypothetical protein QM528_06885 [Phycisphaerales bacterium]|nr:hypothetical protein [Phycisphaerales bacterium]